MWYIYLLRCSDNSFYTGVTTNLKRRNSEHNTGTRGALYTRFRRPVTLVYHEKSISRSTAQIREHAIKKLSHAAKDALTKL